VHQVARSPSNEFLEAGFVPSSHGVPPRHPLGRFGERETNASSRKKRSVHLSTLHIRPSHAGKALLSVTGKVRTLDPQSTTPDAG
jgi:hypothetical protein